MAKLDKALEAGLPRRQAGQSFFELLVAIAVVGLTLTALVSLATRSLSNSTFSKSSTAASRLTQDSLEWIRGQRDQGWDLFYAKSSGAGITYCMSTLNWNNVGSCGSGELVTVDNIEFTREATVKTIDANNIEVAVATSWVDGTGTHESHATTILGKY